jgi:hypothetical protein
MDARVDQMDTRIDQSIDQSVDQAIDHQANPDATDTAVGVDAPAGSDGSHQVTEAGSDASGPGDAPAEGGEDAPVEAPPPDASDVSETGGGCELPMIACDGVCLDPRNDDLNCGSCQRTCFPGEGCMNGSCNPL